MERSHYNLRNRFKAATKETYVVRDSILRLNDYCLLFIFSYLNIRELLLMEKVCPRFQAVAKRIYKSTRVLDFAPSKKGACFTQQEVKNIAKRLCPHIHSLKAHNAVFTNPILSLNHLLRRCTHLENLYLYSFDINKRMLRVLPKTFVNLKVAQLKDFRCTGVRDHAVEQCLREAMQLETLNLAGYSRINGRCLTILQHIQEIDLEDCYSINASYLLAFLRQNQGLKSLGIIGVRVISSLCFDVIANELKSLETLKIDSSYSHIGPSDFLKFANLRSLKHLQIRYLDTEINSFLAKLCEQSMLESLTMFPGETVLKHLPSNIVNSLPKLVLKIRNWEQSLTYDNLVRFTSIERLQELHIPDSVRISRKALTALIKNCRCLKLINIARCSIGNDYITGILPILQDRKTTLEIIVGHTDISNLNKHPKLKLTHGYVNQLW